MGLLAHLVACVYRDAPLPILLAGCPGEGALSFAREIFTGATQNVSKSSLKSVRRALPMRPAPVKQALIRTAPVAELNGRHS